MAETIGGFKAVSEVRTDFLSEVLDNYTPHTLRLELQRIDNCLESRQGDENDLNERKQLILKHLARES